MSHPSTYVASGAFPWGPLVSDARSALRWAAEHVANRRCDEDGRRPGCVEAILGYLSAHAAYRHLHALAALSGARPSPSRLASTADLLVGLDALDDPDRVPVVAAASKLFGQMLADGVDTPRLLASVADVIAGAAAADRIGGGFAA